MDECRGHSSNRRFESRYDCRPSSRYRSRDTSRNRGKRRSRSWSRSRSRSRSSSRSRSQSRDRQRGRCTRSQSPYPAKSPRHVMYRTRLTSLEDYKHEIATINYSTLSLEDKFQLLHATDMPIAVALSPGESLAMLQDHRSVCNRRTLLARQYVEGIERFASRDSTATGRNRSGRNELSSPESGEVCDSSESNRPCQSGGDGATVPLRLDCGCNRCLHACVAELTSKLLAIEKRTRGDL